MIERLGIDIGNVITFSANDSPRAEGYLFTKALPNALEVIAELVARRFKDEVYLVSKCGFRMQARTRQWLRAQDFYAKTGVAPDNVWFCLQRREKANIAEVLGLTHFIDDRLEILSYLTTVPNRILFRPKQKEVDRWNEELPFVDRVERWSDVRALWLTAHETSGA